jgi:Domain of unknown function (DUF1844)
MLSFLNMDSQDTQTPHESQTSFLAFVMSLATSAAVHFGDIEDPSLGSAQRNLPAAAQMIDLLAMLQQKTKGNLDAEEQRFLDQVLYELRMRYITVMQEGGGASAESAPERSRIVTPGGDEPRIIVPGQNEPRIIVP